MSETKEFSAAVAASLSTGILLCKFAQCHDAAEWLMGHSIMTHHFADKTFFDKMKAAAAAQCSKLPSAIPWKVDETNLDETISWVEEQVGKTVTFKKGDGGTILHPLHGLEGKDVVMVGKGWIS